MRTGGTLKAAAAAIVWAAIALAGVAGSGEAALPPGSAVGTAKLTTQSRAEVLEHWTPRRMRLAQTPDRALGRRPAGGTAAPTARRPSFVAPAAGNSDPARIRHGGPADSLTSAFSPGDESRFPNRVHGKVFFSIDGSDFVCSGTAVNSPGRSLVVSAGHCVYGEGEWATNWLFVPGYRDGAAPYGRWTATALRAPDAWVPEENISFDIGMATVARNSRGQGLQNVVGARGIGFDQPRDQLYMSFGYPAEPPFDGESLQACRSRYGGDDDSTDPPRTMFIDCDMNAGASGGGWVADGVLLSLNSYCVGLLIACTAPRLYGPYFGAAARGLYEQSRGRLARCLGRAVTQLGAAGRDSFAGASGRDVISLRGGTDTGLGRRANDTLCGGSGDDTLRGGPGFDVCDGGAGGDQASGCEVRRRIP